VRLSWLAEVLRGAGCTVEELPGWKGRGKPMRALYGFVHHGFGARYEDGWTDTAFDRMLISGRADLPGPLSQLGLDRDGHWVCVADGRANHNGYGTWGNDSIGLEIYGRDSWSDAQRHWWPIGTAAICRHLGWPATRNLAHRETDPGRKPDPIGLDMHAFRRTVSGILSPAPTPTPEPDPDPLPEEDDMACFIRKDGSTTVYLLEGTRITHIQNRTILRDLAASMNIPAQEAVLPVSQFNLLILGRTVVGPNP
jgi:hypothetical protein